MLFVPNALEMAHTQASQLSQTAGEPGVARRTPPVRMGLLGFGLLLFVVSFAGALRTADRSRYTDEFLWQARSQQFASGLVNGRPSEMTAYSVTEADASTSITMPGVPTMWVGTSVIFAECAVDRSGGFRQCVEGSEGPSLPHAHRAMAAFGAALIVALWALSRRLIGSQVAGVAAALMATAPFLTTLRTMFHTDSLVMAFSLIGFVALCRCLELVKSERRPLLMAAVAGLALAASMLTKLSAVAIVPAVAGVVCWAAVRTWRQLPKVDVASVRFRQLVASPLAKSVAVVIVVAVGTVLVFWPALWADPSRQVAALRSSAQLSGAGHDQFFRGEITTAPPWYFFGWVVAFRVTPWVFVGLVLIPLVAIARRADPRWWIFVGFCAAQVLVLGMSAKKFDRYGAALVAGVIILVVVSADLLLGERLRAWGNHRLRSLAWAAFVLVLVVHSQAVAGRGFAYFNPAVGGLEAASSQMMVSWGEARFVSDDWLERRYGDEPYVVCRVKAGQMDCPEGPGSKVFVTYVGNTQRGAQVMPNAASPPWTKVDTYVLDDVEMIQFWEGE